MFSFNENLASNYLKKFKEISVQLISKEINIYIFIIVFVSLFFFVNSNMNVKVHEFAITFSEILLQLLIASDTVCVMFNEPKSQCCVFV